MGLPVSVIVPAYNEEDAIVGVLEGLLEVLRRAAAVDAYEILVVDDGSSDATAERARSVSGVELVQHPRNMGYGAAIKSGIRRARYAWICITDADGTYPNERIPDLLAAAEGAAMVVGARTGDDVEYPFLRRIPKAFLRRYAQWLTRAPIDDMNSGLRVFRLDSARRVLHLLPNGFSLTTTLTMALMTDGDVVRFVPIGYSSRIGKSKIRPIRDTVSFFMLIVRTGTYFAPFRVFMPFAFLLFAIFAASATYDIVVLRDMTDKTLIFLTLSLNLGMFALLADMIQKRAAPTRR